MKTTPFLVSAALLAPLLGCTSKEAVDRDGATATAEARVLPTRGRPQPVELLSLDEILDMKFMREEEKLARDVYLTLYEAWGLQTHANVAQSEQSHTDAVATLLQSLHVDDPVTDDTVGVFVDEDLDALYDELVAWGRDSAVDALLVGATIEDLDMVDLAAAIETSDDVRIDSTYESLLCGSRNHLRAFVGALESLGETYEATFMDPELMEEILAQDHETCG